MLVTINIYCTCLKIISKWKYTADKIIMMPARKDLIKVQYRGSDNNSSALSEYYCTWWIWPKKQNMSDYS
jgi:hypothetical protein